MGKKDEEIERLNKELSARIAENDSLVRDAGSTQKKIEKLQSLNKNLVENNAQHIGDIAALNENHNKAIAEFQKQIQEMQDFRQLMVLNVNITGVQDIAKCLGDATSLVETRLEELKKQDDFVILAVPHTTAVSIPG